VESEGHAADEAALKKVHEKIILLLVVSFMVAEQNKKYKL
jgi:hypothetical protein